MNTKRYTEEAYNAIVALEYVKEACELHDSTNQTYGKYPYSEHIKRVVMEAYLHMDILNIDSDDINTFTAVLFGAAFHDAIEDARLTYNDVMKVAKKYMDSESAYLATEIVYALTNEKGRNRAERANEKYYEGIRNTPFAPFVKLCDRMANYHFSLEELEEHKTSSMAIKYMQEMPEFIKHIGISDEVFNKFIMTN